MKLRIAGTVLALIALLAAAVPDEVAGVSPATAAAAGAPPAEPPYHRIRFPVDGPVSYSDDFGACRSGCTRRHQGNDLMGTKLEREVAATDGTITFVRGDAGGNSGNMLELTATDGWKYWYIHINNDTPGTDDGANPPEWRFAPGIERGTRVKKGDLLAYMGDSGDAESTGPHLHFEVHEPDGTVIDPYASLRLAQGLAVGNRCRYDDNPEPTPSSDSARGYWVLGRDGGVFSYGDAKFHGSTGAITLNRPIVGMAATPTGNGYWLVASDGGIFAYGDAKYHGSTGAITLNRPIVGMAPTPTGNGYWLVASDGGIFAYGDAKYHGSTGAITLNRPIVGMAPTPTGNGYWLVACDGGIFAYGDAKYHGSTGAITLNRPIVGMAPTPTGNGYWLVASDGGIFAFGPARYLGSLPASGWCTWSDAAAIMPSATGEGYWIAGVDGSVRGFGDAVDLGDATGGAVHAIGAAAAPPTPA
ncbi:MAG: M23 family metallopeptidase [Acidimicrobiia bacterium]